MNNSVMFNQIILALAFIACCFAAKADEQIIIGGESVPGYIKPMGNSFKVTTSTDAKVGTGSLKVSFDPGVKSPRYGGIKIDLEKWKTTDWSRAKRIEFRHKNTNHIAPFRVILYGPRDPEKGRKRNVYEFSNSKTWKKTVIDLSKPNPDWKPNADLSKIEYMTLQLYWDPATHPGEIYIDDLKVIFD